MEYTNWSDQAREGTRSAVRIGINAHKLSFAGGYYEAGVSRYIEALLRELPCVAGGDDEITAYTGCIPPEWQRRFPDRIRWSSGRYSTVAPPARILWEQTTGTTLGLRDRLDVFHAPVNVAPLVTGVPRVVTVHDLAFHHFPAQYPAGQRRYLATMTRISTRRAKRVIAVSESTKRDLVALYELPGDQVIVVPNGVDEKLAPLSESEQAAFRAREGLPDHFLLFVGTLQPRKNLDGLLRAYALLADRLDWPLVVIGGAGWLYSPIFRTMRRYGLENRVRFQGYVDGDELPGWYSAATVFVLPSHYEGFGLPVIEAMACGTPVVTSTTSSLPEVAGDSALLADPSKPADIARAIIQLAENEEFQRELAARGRERAARYSWRRAAAETYAVYCEAARG